MLRKINNKGYTYTELVAVITILAIVITVLLFILKPYTNKAKKDIFLEKANTISKAAINKYTNDTMNDDIDIPDDLYKHDEDDDLYESKVCYSIDSLKGKYIKKLDDSFKGTVEICTNSKVCDYKTRIWMTNKDFFIDGAKDTVTKKDLTDKIFGLSHCGEIKVK